MKPFHLSIMVGDLDDTKRFYGDILSLELRRKTENSLQYDFFGHQLVLHIVRGYHTDSTQRIVDGEEVPCPHFGVVLLKEEWEEIKSLLVSAKIDFTVNPHKRFIGLPHEQFVMFVQDFSGNGIELKYYTKVSGNEWA